MATLQTMYPAGTSNTTQITAAINASATEIPVLDPTVFPAGPNFATFSIDNGYEVILYNAVDVANSMLTGCQRGQSGTTAKSWGTGTTLYHSWTNANANAIMENIEEVNNDLEGLTAAQVAYTNMAMPSVVDVGGGLDSVLQLIPPEMHRNIFRGKNLGTSVTAAQKAAIANQTFDDLFVGDYWVISGVNWRIADINYWINCGDTNFTTPHLVIVPDTTLYSATMNDTNTTGGAYVGSKMYTTNLAQAKTMVADAFGDMVLTRREYLSNAVTNGYPSGGAWFDSTVELMNEIMVYGSFIFRPAGDGTIVVNRYTTDNTQLALFMMVPKFVKTRQSYWLRDTVSTANFAIVYYPGDATYSYASDALGVRPVFAIG
jgi:hypothetical protein